MYRQYTWVVINCVSNPPSLGSCPPIGNLTQILNLILLIHTRQKLALIQNLVSNIKYESVSRGFIVKSVMAHGIEFQND